VTEVEVESWELYRKYLLATLERLESDIKGLDRKIDGLRDQITVLNTEFSMQKIRIGLLGAAAGSVPAMIAAVIWLVAR
jgi:hypothetical protein